MTSQDGRPWFLEEEEDETQSYRFEEKSYCVSKTGETTKGVGLEEAKKLRRSIIGVFENPEEICETLRECVTDLIQLADREKDPERLKRINEKLELEKEKWTRAIELTRNYQNQVEQAKKLMLKFLDEEERVNFFAWVEKGEDLC